MFGLTRARARKAALAFVDQLIEVKEIARENNREFYKNWAAAREFASQRHHTTLFRRDWQSAIAGGGLDDPLSGVERSIHLEASYGSLRSGISHRRHRRTSKRCSGPRQICD